MPWGIHYSATAATRWTNTSLTSKEMFFFFRESIQTVVYLGQGWYNTVRVMYCIVPIQYCNVMYCISNFSDKVVF